jgi:hypothetical protein
MMTYEFPTIDDAMRFTTEITSAAVAARHAFQYVERAGSTVDVHGADTADRDLTAIARQHGGELVGANSLRIPILLAGGVTGAGQ